MTPIEDHDYLKICAQVASTLSISLSSARRKVDLASKQSGKKDLESRKKIAEEILNHALLEAKNNDNSSNQFNKLLKALSSEENFMIED